MTEQNMSKDNSKDNRAIRHKQSTYTELSEQVGNVCRQGHV